MLARLAKSSSSTIVQERVSLERNHSHEQTILSSLRPKRWSGALVFSGNSMLAGNEDNRQLENERAGRSDLQRSPEKPKSNSAEAESGAGR